MSARDHNREIYTMNPDGSGVARLTNDPGFDLSPAFSPDGTKIAFSSNRDGDDDIYVMNADGTGLLPLTVNFSYDGYPAWSPDGTKIAFSHDDTSTRFENTTHAEIWVVSADGTGLTSLTNNSRDDTEPAWSPDGTKIAFATWFLEESRGDIQVMNADGTDIRRVTHATFGSQSWGPDWSPDGSTIAFGTFVQDVPLYHVKLVEADGTNERDIGTGNWPSWSPDGSKIVEGDGTVAVMNPDGSGRTTIAVSGFGDYDPDWGPGGPNLICTLLPQPLRDLLCGL